MPGPYARHRKGRRRIWRADALLEFRSDTGPASNSQRRAPSLRPTPHAAHEAALLTVSLSFLLSFRSGPEAECARVPARPVARAPLSSGPERFPSEGRGYPFGG